MKPKKTNKIVLQNPMRYKKIPSQHYFKRWVNLVLTQQQRNNLELTIRVVSKKESATLNKTYRHKSAPTNVLSFPFETMPEISLPLLGDLVICAPVVNQEAKQQNKLWLAHWAHLVIHGTLHLLGYDHIKNKEAVVMENLEIKLLHQLGYANPYE